VWPRYNKEGVVHSSRWNWCRLHRGIRKESVRKKDVEVPVDQMNKRCLLKIHAPIIVFAYNNDGTMIIINLNNKFYTHNYIPSVVLLHCWGSTDYGRKIKLYVTINEISAVLNFNLSRKLVLMHVNRKFWSYKLDCSLHPCKSSQ
jgi:hypothetical protein